MCSSVKLLAAVVGLAAVTSSAQAADLPPPPVAPPVPYSWSGLYIGLNAGYSGATLTETVSSGGGSGSTNIPGAVGGFQIGANYQINTIVLGFEADFDGAAATKSITAGINSGSAQLPWVGTLRARAGLAFDRWLAYVTAGGAATELVSTANVSGVGTANSNFTHGAWTAGGGLEAAITNDLSVKVEYLYLDTGNIFVAQLGATPPPPTLTINGRLHDNLVRAGLNYRLPVAW
jgi:outer membrane immunogenic protein